MGPTQLQTIFGILQSHDMWQNESTISSICHLSCFEESISTAKKVRRSHMIYFLIPNNIQQSVRYLIIDPFFWHSRVQKHNIVVKCSQCWHKQHLPIGESLMIQSLRAILSHANRKLICQSKVLRIYGAHTNNCFQFQCNNSFSMC